MDEFVREAARLTTDYITTRSVAIVVRNDAGQSACGTSTCVQVGDHFLLATAGHVIEDIDDQGIQLIPASELSSRALPFIGRSCSPSRPAPPTDVAWIELAPEVVRDNRLRFLTTSDLKLRQSSNDRDHPFLVHGYPSQSAILSPTGADLESTVAFTMMAAAKDLHRRLAAYEVATEYPPRDEENQPIAVAPRAHGLSGGGVWWHPRHDQTNLTSPTYMKLVAVNTRWHQSSAVLFSTHIDQWLRVVGEDFRDAKTVLEALEPQ